MKLGIITTHWALNYGAVLQSYALEKYLQSQGYDCEIVDYRPQIGQYGRNYVVWNKNIKQWCQNLIKLVHIKNKKLFYKKIEAFDDFVEQELDKSVKTYITFQDMQEIGAYDALICGSDQIWNLNLFDMPAFFLPYKNKYPKTKFISYAASIAQSLSEEQWKTIIQRTTHFDAVSIREAETTEQYNRYQPGKAVTVLDPVFLLDKDEWDNRIGQNSYMEKDSYILCYFIGYRGLEYDLIRKVQETNPGKIVNVGQDPTNHLKADVQLTNVSPFEFVALIRDAKYIVTNSFHMTAFSIIFRKNFLLVEHKNRNSRMANLITTFLMNDRFIRNRTQIAHLGSKDLLCDYSKIEENLEKNIQFSKQYLYKALEENAANDEI